MEKPLPWFLECFLHPPADPLTRQLIAEVKDLPEVPGPQTVGSKAYSRILVAFENRGWPGFEQAFDAVISPDRTDYVSIKRELLRESMFRPIVHERLTRILAGETTVEETLAAIRREKEKNH